MPHHKRKIFHGPALFSYGFRPFFLLALGFAVLVIPLWLGFFSGVIPFHGNFSPLDWHIHEMLFGYAAAVIRGFLFTAIPNWTGRMPIKGWPLAVLASVWIAGRLVMLGIGGLPALAVMAIDSAFLLAIAVMIVTEIVAGSNWRNLKVVGPVVLLLAANVLFHIEVFNYGVAEYGRRLSFVVVIFLIMLIGGRIIPSFTRNWLARCNPGPLPVAANRFDAICLLAGAFALALWVGAPNSVYSGWVLILVAVLHARRMLRWKGYRTWRSPLLLMLHIGYGFIPLGLAVVGSGAQTAGLHLLGIGAIAGMTVAVMTRATLGHTGRSLNIRPAIGVAFILLMMAAGVRSAMPLSQVAGWSGVQIAALLWTVGFGTLLANMAPWLWSARITNRP